MITWKITRSCINNNMDFVLKSLLLRPFYISYNTCISIIIDSGSVVFSLFLEFRKAFDCVHHEILLSKLNTYDSAVWGIALDWFHSHLTNREQYVSVNNVDSNPGVIQCGVQGSILDSLLFLIFINDITKCSNQFIYILFTDDSTLPTSLPAR